MKKIQIILLALVLLGIGAGVSFAAEEDEFRQAVEDSNIVAVFVRDLGQLRRFTDYLERTKQLPADVPNAETAYKMTLWRESRGLDGEEAEKYLVERIQKSSNGGRVVVVPFLPLKDFVRRANVAPVVVQPVEQVQVPAPVVVTPAPVVPSALEAEVANLKEENRQLKQEVLSRAKRIISLRKVSKKQTATINDISEKLSAVAKTDKIEKETEARVRQANDRINMMNQTIIDLQTRLNKLENPPTPWYKFWKSSFTLPPFPKFSITMPQVPALPKNAAFYFAAGTAFASSLFTVGIVCYVLGRRSSPKRGNLDEFLGEHEVEAGGVVKKFKRKVVSECETCGPELIVIHEKEHIRNTHSGYGQWNKNRHVN